MNRYIVLALTSCIYLSLGTCLSHLHSQESASHDEGHNRSSFEFKPESFSNAIRWTKVEPGLPANLDENKLLEKFSRPSTAWIGAITYGDDRSTSVAIAVCGESDDLALLLDSDRNGVFDESEKHQGKNREESILWQVPLAAGFDAEPSIKRSENNPDTDESPGKTLQMQQIALRYNPSENKLSVQSAGAMVGEAEYRGKLVAARYEDRNANGLWFDQDDRVFVDFNDDGKLNRLLERLPAQGTRMLQGELTAILSSRRGDELGFRSITEQGFVTPSLNLQQTDAAVEELTAVLSSATGIQVRINGLDKTELPIGEYFVREVKLTTSLEDGKRHTFHFGLDRQVPNITVRSGETTAFALLGKLSLSGKSMFVKSGLGNNLVVTPILKAESGLYLINCLTGQGKALSENRLRCTVFAKGRSVLGGGSSGFS